MALTPHAQFTENADPRVRRCGDIADGHQAVVVVFHAFHHTRNAVHSDPGELIHHPGQERADDRHDEPPGQEHGHKPGAEVLHVLREVLHLRARRLPRGAFFLDLSAQRTVVVLTCRLSSDQSLLENSAS